MVDWVYESAKGRRYTGLMRLHADLVYVPCLTFSHDGSGEEGRGDVMYCKAGYHSTSYEEQLPTISVEDRMI